MAISGTCLFGGRSARDLPKRARAQHELDLVPAIIGNTGGNQAQSRWQSSAITMEIKRNHDGNQAQSRWQSSGITMAIKRNHDGNQAQSDGAIRWRSDLARSRSLAPFEISHDLRRHRVVRVGEHPKQIGLAQPLARDTHGDAPDELGLESMAHLWGDMGRYGERGRAP